MQKVQPTSIAHHIKQRKGIDKCRHVFLRTDAVKLSLKAPYTGPHEIVRRENDRVFTIRLNGHESAVLVDRLKPAFLVKDDRQLDS